ncbi:hypothetical protein ACRAVF_01800 [Bradyrhizobium oligotrophicum S58]
MTDAARAAGQHERFLLGARGPLGGRHVPMERARRDGLSRLHGGFADVLVEIEAHLIRPDPAPQRHQGDGCHAPIVQIPGQRKRRVKQHFSCRVRDRLAGSGHIQRRLRAASFARPSKSDRFQDHG